MNPLDHALQQRRRALEEAFADYDPAAATQRLASRIVQENLAASLIRPRPVPDPDGSGPDTKENAARNRAAAEIEHLCRLVIARPDTSRLLGEFVGNRAPAGAVVFACLLYLTGRWEPAAFWWRFAAGAEQGEAMRFLVLHHRAEGESGDAQCWTDRIPDDTAPTPSAAPSGRRTSEAETYVSRAESAIRAVEHPDFGEVCVPQPSLPCRVTVAGHC
ncbi:hypothetical protein ACIRL2_45985 [Embleya sp. NPDC127516]|uniref:hypothetical protein n=1 Tax=Embleya sp. NPDC127516 TaxID=3363990 RepID=UPI00381240B8